MTAGRQMTATTAMTAGRQMTATTLQKQNAEYISVIDCLVFLCYRVMDDDEEQALRELCQKDLLLPKT